MTSPDTVHAQAEQGLTMDEDMIDAEMQEALALSMQEVWVEIFNKAIRRGNHLLDLSKLSIQASTHSQ